MADKIVKTKEQWKQKLSDDEYRITREAGTEPAFTGRYCNNKDTGMYTYLHADVNRAKSVHQLHSPLFF